MKVKQFEYKPLAHYSYALVSNGEMVVIDPERNPEQYLSFAKQQNAQIKAVIETHPHADFVSAHLELHERTGATIYNSEKIGATYPHQAFDEGDSMMIGDVKLSALFTPGHSPDSITVVASHKENPIVLFTGDTLFIGDVGRPDLREKAGNMKAKRKELAEMMFETIQTKFNSFPDDAIVYPAHGAGSLCGKNLSEENSSTLGQERKTNWAFQTNDKEKFVKEIISGQPFIPSYFGYNVDVNKDGANQLQPSIEPIPFQPKTQGTGIIVDTRNHDSFKENHIAGSINIQADTMDDKFETWLGSIIKPKESFSIVVESENERKSILHRIAKIGYEAFTNAVITLPDDKLVKSDEFNINEFKEHPNSYTIVDVRNSSETPEKIFETAISHPLNQLRSTANKIPTNQPIVVHCAGGYRSAAASSIIKATLPTATVYDLGDNITEFL